MIVANAEWNDTGIDLVKGARYRMTATGSWHDRQFRAGPDGVPPQNLVQRIFSPLLRFPNGHYMTLIGCIDQDMGSAFAIGANAKKCAAPGFVAGRRPGLLGIAGHATSRSRSCDNAPPRRDRSRCRSTRRWPQSWRVERSLLTMLHAATGGAHCGKRHSEPPLDKARVSQ